MKQGAKISDSGGAASPTDSQSPRLPGSQCHCQRQAKRRRHSSLNLTLNLSIFPSHAVFKSSNTQILSVFSSVLHDKTASDATPRPRVKTTWAEGLLPLPLQNQWRSMRHQTASIATDSTDSRTIKIHKCHNNQSRLTTDQGEQQDRSSSPASQVHQGACAITYRTTAAGKQKAAERWAQKQRHLPRVPAATEKSGHWSGRCDRNYLSHPPGQQQRENSCRTNAHTAVERSYHSKCVTVYCLCFLQHSETACQGRVPQSGQHRRPSLRRRRRCQRRLH